MPKNKFFPYKEYSPLLKCLSFSSWKKSQTDTITHSLQKYVLRANYLTGAQNTKARQSN